MKHTAEPWARQEHALGGIVNSSGDVILQSQQTKAHGLDEEREANADRAVECVNALARVEDPQTKLVRLLELAGDLVCESDEVGYESEAANEMRELLSRWPL